MRINKNKKIATPQCVRRNSTQLPQVPGVYLFKNEQGDVLYIGKAKNLKSRVSSYFHKQDNPKIAALIQASTQIDHIVTYSELEALLLEASLIQQYQPKYNIDLKGGQPYVYLLFTNAKLPELTIARNKDKRGTYFGPFLERGPARRVYDFLIETFRLRACKRKIENGCMYYHMGLCSGMCRPDFDEVAYRERLELAKQVLKKGHKKFLKYLEQQIAQHNKLLEFEKSQELHGYHQAFEKVFGYMEVRKPFDKTLRDGLDKLDLLRANGKEGEIPCMVRSEASRTKGERKDSTVQTRSISHANACFTQGERERDNTQYFYAEKNKKAVRPEEAAGRLEGSNRTALTELQSLLQLSTTPHTIDCFDISHHQGKNMVGSCIRFTDGKPDKNKFRRFKIKTVEQQDDYACLQEIVSRRYRNPNDIPDLILIDGGKGQLHAIEKLFPHAECASLAKREETLFSRRIPHGTTISVHCPAGQLLIALRDYAHHFAITYHRKKSTGITH